MHRFTYERHAAQLTYSEIFKLEIVMRVPFGLCPQIYRRRDQRLAHMIVHFDKMSETIAERTVSRLFLDDASPPSTIGHFV